ncbi:abortive infection family protein [Patescibacteria group bacterium]|nr:abortive infection family protein [Patescibacteria group bacterium]
MLEHLENDYERVEYLQNLLVSFSTAGDGDNDEYKYLRALFLKDATLKKLLPDFIRTKRSLNEFWEFIKRKFAHYYERREFLWKNFNPALSYLEERRMMPSENLISETLKRINVDTIYRGWEKALGRVKSDPDGAITSARALIESVCKFILDEKCIVYNSEVIQIHDLYKTTAKELNLSVEQHHENIFKQILGGCSGVISGLGLLRNKLGDAHGSGKVKIRPKERHARLAVNLAGSMALFLLETFLENDQ